MATERNEREVYIPQQVGNRCRISHLILTAAFLSKQPLEDALYNLDKATPESARSPNKLWRRWSHSFSRDIHSTQTQSPTQYRQHEHIHPTKHQTPISQTVYHNGQNCQTILVLTNVWWFVRFVLSNFNTVHSYAAIYIEKLVPVKRLGEIILVEWYWY